MNRNTNAHFSEVPSADIQRSILDRSHSHKTSGNVGDIIPVFVDPDIMPGDTVSVDTSKVIRFQTLLTPMMDNIQADFYWFFTPHRLVWDHWINFMGENTDSAWLPEVTYSVPRIIVPKTSTSGSLSTSGTILDYMGFPVGLNTSNDIYINALPIRAYSKIVNDWFRSENLTDPVNLYTGDSDKTAIGTGSYITDVPLGGAPFKAAKYQDYFTSALPSPQKGDAVSINLTGSSALPVVATDSNSFSASASTSFTWPNMNVGKAGVYHMHGSTSDTSYSGIYKMESDNKLDSGSWKVFDTAAGAVGSDDHHILEPANFWAAAPTGLSFTVNDMRYAFQLQKLLERDARGGTRYIEVIRSHFGVTSPDARMQRSEYLGGNRFGIVIDQVSNQAQTEQDFLGDLGAFSVTSDVHSDFTHSFTEHGTLMCLMVLRYDHTYAQGLEKFWYRRNRFDFYWPVFANIGEQPIMKSELYADGAIPADGNEVFGYNEAWAEYRYKPNRVSGEMRPYVSNGLYSWTLADDYNAAPSLSDGWIREDKTNVDRVLSVTSSVSNQFWADIYFNMKYTRPMPVFSVPGLIDHH